MMMTKTPLAPYTDRIVCGFMYYMLKCYVVYEAATQCSLIILIK